MKKSEFSAFKDRIQNIIDCATEQIKGEAVRMIVGEKEYISSADITIHIDADMVPTITYSKEVLVANTVGEGAET